MVGESDGQVHHIRRGGGHRPGGRSVTTINAGDLLHCVNGTASSATDCSGVKRRTPGQVPNFIHFVSMDVEVGLCRLNQVDP
jgi:hypothetical protein